METALEQFKHCRNDALTHCRISETVMTLMCDILLWHANETRRKRAVSYSYIFVVF